MVQCLIATAFDGSDFPHMTSRIATVETYVVSYPVAGHFKFFQASGRPARETVAVKITDSDGIVGWGQSVPSHTWSYETLETVRTTIDQYLGPALIDFDPFDTDGLWKAMNRVIAASFSTGQPICKAGIDLALFDLTGRIAQQNTAARWGRSDRNRITLSWTVDVRSLQEVEASVSEARQHGFHHFNVKIGSDIVFDEQVCRELRRFAADAFIWVDANGGYDLEAALAIAPRLAELGIAALEQPFPANRLSFYAGLRRQGALPVLMDEGIVSLTDLVEFHQLGLLDGVAMKVSRCGGLSEARRIVDYMQQNGLLFFASGLTDPDLSLAASLLLFGAYGLERPAALNAPQFLTGSILKTPIAITGDEATVPAGFGLGVEVDESHVEGEAN